MKKCMQNDTIYWGPCQKIAHVTICIATIFVCSICLCFYFFLSRIKNK